MPGVNPFLALCNGDIADGGWIVMQKRFDGSENFLRNWTDYRNSFGNLNGELYIGLELLYRITSSGPYELYIQMKRKNGSVEFADYDGFQIDNEDSKYMLKTMGEFKGSALDLMDPYNRNGKFTTKDSDNDDVPDINCAWDRWNALKSLQMLIRSNP